MLIAGLAVGFAGLFAVTWTFELFDDPNVRTFAPLIGSFVVFLTAPTIGVMLGLLEGLREFTPKHLLETTFGTLVGAVLLVFVALFTINSVAAMVTGSGGAGSIGLQSVVSVAGLISLTSATGAAAAMLVSGKL
jgi:uncharacterized membrane protein required for colicin V production